MAGTVYGIYDIHDQDYEGEFVATVFSPVGIFRVRCDGIANSGQLVSFYRRSGDAKTTVTVIHKKIPYMMLETSLMHRVTEEELFEEQLDAEARGKIYRERMERFRNAQNDSSDSHPSVD